MDSYLRFSWVADTDQGQTREKNEDSIARFKVGDTGWAVAVVVADGMGGHKGGEVASHMVVQGLQRELRDLDPDFEAIGEGWQKTIESSLKTILNRVNSEVFRRSEETPELSGMGSTMVMILFVADWYCVVHVGDSRAYRLRTDYFKQLTIDHSWAEEQRVLGALPAEEIDNSPFAGHLLRSIGFEDQVVPTVSWGRTEAGDLFLLCSDGLTRYLDGPALGKFLSSSAAPKDLEGTAAALLHLANERGGRDNISVGMFHFLGYSGPPLPMPEADTVDVAELDWFSMPRGGFVPDSKDRRASRRSPRRSQLRKLVLPAAAGTSLLLAGGLWWGSKQERGSDLQMQADSTAAPRGDSNATGEGTDTLVPGTIPSPTDSLEPQPPASGADTTGSDADKDTTTASTLGKERGGDIEQKE